MSHFWVGEMLKNSRQKLIQKIKDNGGQIRMSEVIRFGFCRRTLYSLFQEGKLIRVSRGIYRLSELPQLSNPDLVTAMLRIPKGVVCLVSALSFHNITTQIPKYIDIAIERGASPPRLQVPPVSIYKFSNKSFQIGVTKHIIDGVEVRIYSPEKTLIDCFKFRNRLGMDVVLEALNLYRSRIKLNADDLLYFAKICRVDKVVRPYLEATL